MSRPEERTVSWLTMERYALGELSEVERREVELCLRDSEANRSRLEQILNDRSELPELPVVPLRTRKPSRGWLGAGSLLAAAAAVALGFVSLRHAADLQAPAVEGGGHTKGGDVALVLVSESGERAPSKFAEGERFKVLVTCPPGFEDELRLFVFQAGQRYEPLSAARVPCGNSVAWPGAFALDGAQGAEVCLAWGAGAAQAHSRQALGDNAVCSELAPR